MPILLIAVLGGAIGLYLVATNRVNTQRIVLFSVAVLGAGLGIYTLRALSLISGPVGALMAATAGAALLLWAFLSARK
ncbi:MAG: hypothetical protein AAFX00_07850 [Pseudomonadota bacterium]